MWHSFNEQISSEQQHGLGKGIIIGISYQFFCYGWNIVK